MFKRDKLVDLLFANVLSFFIFKEFAHFDDIRVILFGKKRLKDEE
jgi:hypothetical protein